MSVYLRVLILLISCFVIMCGYRYVITKAKRPRKPSDRRGLYVPLILPLIWYLLNVGICNVQNSTGDLVVLLIGFRSLHLFSFAIYGSDMQIFGLDLWHSMLLWNLFYDFVFIWGFAVGERLSAKKTGVEPTGAACYKKVIAAILFAVVFSVYALSEAVLFKQRENIVESARPSYNFSYAGGYSGIDLRPYSVENDG